MEFIASAGAHGDKEWRGKFYPAKISTDDMLPYDAERFGSRTFKDPTYVQSGMQNNKAGGPGNGIQCPNVCP